MQISKIQKTKQGRFSLFDENGEFLFSVDSDTLLRYGLAEDTSLTDAELAAVREHSDARKAVTKAYTYLSMRDYATDELYRKLCLKFDEHTSAAAMAEMQRLDLLDDEKFARNRARYLASQNKSRREIAFRLSEKGVPRDIIEAVLDELDIDGDSACYALIQKSYRTKLAQGKRDNVIAALARRGFSYGDIKAALARAEEEDGDDDF